MFFFPPALSGEAASPNEEIATISPNNLFSINDGRVDAMALRQLLSKVVIKGKMPMCDLLREQEKLRMENAAAESGFQFETKHLNG